MSMAHDQQTGTEPGCCMEFMLLLVPNFIIMLRQSWRDLRSPSCSYILAASANMDARCPGDDKSCDGK